MAESALLNREDQAARALDSGGFRALQELTRHGYMPDGDATVAGEGLLMRHPSAPDLVLRPNGSIEVPSGQSLKHSAIERGEPVQRKRRWGRMLLILMAVTAYTMLAFVMMMIILES